MIRCPAGSAENYFGAMMIDNGILYQVTLGLQKGTKLS